LPKNERVVHSLSFTHLLLSFTHPQVEHKRRYFEEFW